MAGKYTLRVPTEFAAAHRLHGYPGDCSRLHGHNWKVEIEVTGEKLDDVGMVVDFKVIKRVAKEVADQLDHGYLNEIPPFDEINPTAEHLARYFYREIGERLNDDSAQVTAVTLWETDRACVRYSE